MLSSLAAPGYQPGKTRTKGVNGSTRESFVGLPDASPDASPDDVTSDDIAQAGAPADPEKGGCPASLLGGQAVMDGILMRNGPVCAMAMRLPDKDIIVLRRPWYGFSRGDFSRKPFVRGFPMLLETLINGIKALNRSAELSAKQDSETISSIQLAATLFIALAMAVGLFVVAPHLLSLGMKALGLGGDVERLSFHLWDGLFKFGIFIGYISLISLMPDIRTVFQYHGAEHKVIAAYEAGGVISAQSASRFSRLHPRCGTTFLLFVLSIAIILHALIVPLLLWLWQPQHAVLKHVGTITFKILLMVPISALAYEVIRYAAQLGDNLAGHVLRAPGLLLQILTTREPDESQMEVALVALREALGESSSDRIKTPAYTVLE